MLRFVFVFLITIHGLIHLMGFAKAFEWAQLEQLSQDISRAKGLWWLAAALLIILGILSFLFRQAWWWIPGVLGAVVSQILIFSQWEDARIGTFPNLILLLIAILGFGAWQFKQAVRSDLKDFHLEQTHLKEPIKMEALQGLPKPVQTWLQGAGIVGKESAQSIYLQQKGSMRTAPDGKWMQFEAEQWFRTENPGFLWYARVGMGSPVRLNGRDQLIEGQGKMQIKLFGLIPIVDATGPTIDQGTLVRYLAEMIWFPSAALEPYIHWEVMDENHARANLTVGEQKVSGVFTFNASGEVIDFEALRYYDRQGTASLETWHIDIDPNSYQEFNGIRIPAKSEVSWQLKEGDFQWLKLEIIDHHIS